MVFQYLSHELCRHFEDQCYRYAMSLVTDTLLPSQNVGQLFDIIRYDRTGGPVEEQEGNPVLKPEHAIPNSRTSQ